MRIQYLLFSVYIVLFLTGCSSTSVPPVDEYLLSGKVEQPMRQVETDIKCVRLYPVSVADYLAGDRMLVVGEDGRVYRARHHLWAESVAAQLGRIARTQLASRLPDVDWYESAAPAERKCFRLLIRVDAFQATLDGYAQIRGNWKLFSAKGVLVAKDRFDQKNPLPQSGYPPMVEALNRGWNAIVNDIAEKMATASTGD
ncbi:MAG: PqiC family protein [Thermodesulfobacteriota bacterium]